MIVLKDTGYRQRTLPDTIFCSLYFHIALSDSDFHAKLDNRTAFHYFPFIFKNSSILLSTTIIYYDNGKVHGRPDISQILRRNEKICFFKKISLVV